VNSKDRLKQLRDNHEKHIILLENAVSVIDTLVDMVPRNSCSAAENGGCACSGFCMKSEVKGAIGFMESVQTFLDEQKK